MESFTHFHIFVLLCSRDILRYLMKLNMGRKKVKNDYKADSNEPAFLFHPVFYNRDRIVPFFFTCETHEDYTVFFRYDL